jgi:hypothetical protein
LTVFEEGAEDIGELYGVGDFAVEFDASVLDEEGVGGEPEFTTCPMNVRGVIPLFRQKAKV